MICNGIKVAITSTIWNRLAVDPVRGAESHPLRQKFFTVDFLNKKRKVNEGEVQQDYDGRLVFTFQNGMEIEG